MLLLEQKTGEYSDELTPSCGEDTLEARAVLRESD
jgi:hypothetical protein